MGSCSANLFGLRAHSLFIAEGIACRHWGLAIRRTMWEGKVVESLGHHCIPQILGLDATGHTDLRPFPLIVLWLVVAQRGQV